MVDTSDVCPILATRADFVSEANETPPTASPLAPGLLRASQILEQARTSTAPSWPPRWDWRETAGRLCELAGGRASANLSLACSLVLDAQRRGENVAWIQSRSSSFFPADLAENGVDLAALIVVRPPRPADLGLAADWIARSGAFGLIVLDLTCLPFAPMAMQARLLALAQKHDSSVVCLTEKSALQASLSSLVGLRADTLVRRPSRACEHVGEHTGERTGDGDGVDKGGVDKNSADKDSSDKVNAHSSAQPLDAARLLSTFECELSVTKDKRRSRPWRHCEVRRGTPGLC